jgi:heterodisulfide reductase subunit A-like polyferredoxin
MPSLWRAECQPQQSRVLDGNVSCDLVIVGSGIAGLSSAYEAASCGAKVIAIDRVHACRLYCPLEQLREMLGLPMPWVTISARRLGP